MKIAIAQKRPSKDGRRLMAFYDDKYIVYDYAAEELSYRAALRVPAVVCFDKDGTQSDWKIRRITFDPECYEKRTVMILDHLHAWIDAGVRLAASEYLLKPLPGYPNVLDARLGRHAKPLYYLVWERGRSGRQRSTLPRCGSIQNLRPLTKTYSEHVLRSKTATARPKSKTRANGLNSPCE
jgi:hypothetical protein